MFEIESRKIDLEIERYSKSNKVVHSSFSINGRDICRGYENADTLLNDGLYLGYVFKSKDLTKSHIRLVFQGGSYSSIKSGVQAVDLKRSIVACKNTSVDGGTFTYDAVKTLCNALPIGKMLVIKITSNYQV